MIDNPDNQRPVDRLDDEDLWKEVRAGYLAETPTRDPALAAEISCIRGAMQYFREPEGRRYVITAFLGVGATGVVFKSWDTTLLTSRALKIARPIEGKEDLIAGLLAEEISHLQEVSHPNIVSIFDAGALSSSAGPLPFFTMTYLRGALKASKYFSHPRTSDQILNFFQGTFAGVQHLHRVRLLHLDIKPSNIFVADDGFAVVADLGGAREIVGDPDESLTVICSSPYAHPDLLALTAETSGKDTNRRRGPVLRKQLKFEFDRFALGRTLFEIVHAIEGTSPGQLTRYEHKYILLQAARLLDGRTSPSERPLGLTESSLNRLKYSTTDEVVQDFDKLLERENLLHQIPELSPTNDSVIQVVPGRRTRVTSRLDHLLKEPLVRRLGSVSQLGLTRLVYPGASHTRLEHSLGAYSNAAEYIIALYNDAINPLFRQIMSKQNLVATLLAALLHDLGQYQHAHDLDDVESKIFKHETLTLMLLKGTWYNFEPLTRTLKSAIESFWDVKLGDVIAILEADPTKLTSDIRNRILHTIISGPLDVDKLDYLIRDSDRCQTAFGKGLDRERLLATLTVVYQREGRADDQYFALGIHEKGRAAAESVGFIRFQMFRAVYWHHTVRAAKAMLQRAVFEWVAPNGRDASQHDRLKHELHEFVLQATLSDKGATPDDQPQLFGNYPAEPQSRVGFLMRPQWTGLDQSDLLALRWIYEKTSDTGRFLIDALVRRELYKRVFVVSAAQDPPLWTRIQKAATDHQQLRKLSEELREAIKRRVDSALLDTEVAGKRFLVSGLGQDLDAVAAAAKVLGRQGTVLLDVPMPRFGETLRFYPEEIHRGMREEFDAPALLSVSELWNLLSENLHQTAGSIRVFIHPDVDILRRARKDTKEAPLLAPQALSEDLDAVFPP